MPEIVMAVRLDDEDQATLDALMAREKLNRSDVVRRAIRAYAKKLRVQAPKRKRKR